MHRGRVPLLVLGIPEIQPGDLPAVERPGFPEEIPLQTRDQGIDPVPGLFLPGPGPAQGQAHGHRRPGEGPASQALPGDPAPEARGQLLGPSRLEL